MRRLRKLTGVFLVMTLLVQVSGAPPVMPGAVYAQSDGGSETAADISASMPVETPMPTDTPTPADTLVSVDILVPTDTASPADAPVRTDTPMPELTPESTGSPVLIDAPTPEPTPELPPPSTPDPLLHPAPLTAAAPALINLTSVQQFLVDFYTYDGAFIASQLVPSGAAAVQPLPPDRAGYAFVGWSPPVDNVTANIETYATYQVLQSYSVIINYYYADSGAPAASSTIEFYYAGEAVDNTYLPVAVAGYTPNAPSFAVQTDAMAQNYSFDFVYTASSNTTYTVEYLFEQLDGSYAVNAGYTQQFSGVTGSFVQAQPLPAADTVGYSMVSAGSCYIAADGSSLVQVLYQRLSFTITYDTGSGGEYIPPVILMYGAPVPAPITPVRPGYTFNGWTVTPPGSATIPATMPTSDLLFTAVWTPLPVSYQVIYWLENIDIIGDPGTNPNNYAYYSQTTAKAPAGTTVSLGAGNVTAVPYATFGFADQNVTISGDGTTVINVYFKRIIYTVTFSLNTTSASAYMIFDGVTYTSSKSYSIQVKYMQNIGTIWPSLKNATFSSGFAGWKASFSSSMWATHRFVFTSDMIPTSGTSYTVSASWSNVVPYRANYWFEALPGDTAKQYVYSGTTYTLSLYDSQDVAMASGSSLGAKAIAGMGTGQVPTNLQFKAGGAFIGDYSTTSQSTYNGEFNFFYLRLRYTLSFNSVSSVPAPASSTLPFGMPLSGYDPGWNSSVTYTDINGVTYSFAGWYQDSACLIPFSFSGTMPGGNVGLFAKWTPETVTVTYIDRGNVLSQIMVNAGTQLTPYTPVRQGYVFMGWFLDAACTQPFSYATTIFANTTLHAAWTAGYTGYTVNYLMGGPGGAPVPGLSQKVVQNVYIGATVTEAAAQVPSYFPDSISKSLTLDLDASQNIIDFYYAQAADVPYTVEYVDAATGLEIPGVPVKLASSSDSRVVENYLAITGYTPRLYQISAWLSADPSQNVLIFLYDANTPVQYTVINMAQTGVLSDGSPIYAQYGGPIVMTGPIGSMTQAEPIPMPPQYTYVGGNDPQVLTPNSNIVIYLYYDITYTVSFTTQGNGTLTGQSSFSGIPCGAPFNYVNIPIPVASPGSVFVGWDSLFPAQIFSDMMFTAIFEPIPTLVITSGTAAKVYDGTPLTNHNVSYDPSVLMSGHTLYVAAIGSITNVGQVLNFLSMAHVTDANGVDVTYLYKIVQVDGTLTITPANIPLVITAESATRMYNGVPLTDPNYSYNAGALIAGNVLTAVVEGSILLPGSVENTLVSWTIVDASGADVSVNYLVTPVNGELTVIPYAPSIIVRAASAQKAYDGNPLTNPGYLYNFMQLVPGDTLTAVVTGSITNVGVADNVITSMVVTNAQGVDVTSGYSLETVDGKLVVLASDAALTITAASAMKAYDGLPLTAPTYTYDSTLLAQGDTLTATVSGSITQAGSVDNVVSSWQITDSNGNDVSANYNVGTVDGTLTVVTATMQIVVTADSATKEYDGVPLTDAGYTYDAALLFAGDTLTAVTSGSILNAGSVPNNVSSVVITNSAGEDVTASYNILPQAGVLRILPVSKILTVTAANSIKAYNGAPLVNSGYSFDQTVLLPGQVVLAVVVGTITNVGVVPNHITSMTVLDARGNDITANYQLVPVDGQLAVVQPFQTLVITADSASKPYDGTPLTAPGYSYNPARVFYGHTLTAVTSGSIVNVGSTGNLIASWQITDAAGNDVSSNYVVQIVTGTLTVVPVETTLLIQAASGSKFYDGSPLTNPGYTFDASLLVPGDALSATVNGSITDVGTASNDVAAYQIINASGEDVTGDYTVAVASGTLTVFPTEIPLVITAASAQKVYDGLPLTDHNYTYDASLLVPGHTLTATVTGSVTAVGSTQNLVTGWMITDQSGRNVTANYTVEAVAGTLTVYPAAIRDLIITAGSANKPYDGTPLTYPAYTFDLSVLFTGHMLSASVDGSITMVGQTANIPVNIIISDRFRNDVSSMYNIIPVDGALTITPAEIPIDITAASDQKIYDGTLLTNPNYQYDESTLMPGDALVASLIGSILLPGTVGNIVQWSITNADGEDVTQCYTVNATNGTLTVLPVPQPIVITAGSAQKTYDGMPLTDPTYTFDDTILIAGDTLTATVTGSITNVGSVPNAVASYVITNQDGIDVTLAYNVSTVNGQLDVLPTDYTFTITAASDTKAYDGTPLINPAYTFDQTLLAAGDTVQAVVEGSITQVGTVANVITNWEITNASGDDVSANYTMSILNGALTVTPAILPVIVTAGSASKVYDGAPFTEPGYIYDSSLLFAGDTLTAVTAGSITYVGSIVNKVASVVITNADGVDVTQCYTITIVDGTLTVLPVPQPIVITAGSAQKTYDGTPLTDPTYTFDDTILIAGDTLTATVTGSITNVGSVPNAVASYVITNQDGIDVTLAYNVSTVNGQLDVLPADYTFTITAASDTKAYDGTPLTNPTYTFDQTLLAAGDTAYAVVEGAITQVGTAANVITSWGIQNASGEDVSASYTTSILDGALTVTPAILPVIVTAGSASKVYDGTPLTESGYAYDSSRLFAGDTLTAVTTGNITNVGSALNGFASVSITNDLGEDVTGCYAITRVSGTLRVTRRSAYVTVTAASDHKVYDGTPLTDPEFTYDETAVAPGQTVAAVVQGSITDVGVTANRVVSAAVLDANDADVTLNYQMIFLDGQLTITPNITPILITASSAEKPYDGTPLTDASYAFDAAVLTQGHTLIATVTGSIINPGTAENLVTGWTVTDENNQDVSRDYNIETVPGTLTVLPPRALEITAGSATKVYDGTPLTDPGYTFDPGVLLPGHMLLISTYGSIVDVGEVPNMLTPPVITDASGNDKTFMYDVTLVTGLLSVTPEPTPTPDITSGPGESPEPIVTPTPAQRNGGTRAPAVAPYNAGDTMQ